MMNYEEIMLKYVEGKLFKMYDWILDNLQTDPEIIAGTCKDKKNLQKFLQEQADALEEFILDGGYDYRESLNDSDVFGDDDIITAPGSTLDERSDEFMSDDDDDDEPDWGFQND